MTTPIDIRKFAYCGVCYGYYKNMACLQLHFTAKHTTMYKCRLCNSSEPIQMKIKNHMEALHNHTPSTLHFCSCCFDLFFINGDRERHESSDNDRRSENKAFATSPYDYRSLSQHITIRSPKFGEYYAEKFCSYVLRINCEEAVETFYAILTMHLEVTNEDREAFTRRRTDLLNKEMRGWSTEARERLFSLVNKLEQAAQVRGNPTMNPNPASGDALQGPDPSIDAEQPVHNELHNLPPQAGPGFDAPMNQMMHPAMIPARTTPDIDIGQYRYCGICYEYFVGTGGLREHFAKKHTTGFRCIECNEQIPTDIKWHMRVVHKFLDRCFFCVCCLDMFNKMGSRYYHELRTGAPRPDSGVIATSPYATGFLHQDNTIRRREFGEHYAEKFCAVDSNYEIVHKILTMHLEKTNPGLSTDAVDQKRFELFDAVMRDATPAKRKVTLSNLRQRVTVLRHKWEQNQQASFERRLDAREQRRKAEQESNFQGPSNPTVSPNTGSMNQLQNPDPSMYAEQPVYYELHNMRPQPEHDQQPLMQQQMGSGMEPGFDVPTNPMMNPNSGPMDPTQFQGHNPVMHAMPNQQYLEQNQGQFQHHPPMNYGMEQHYQPHQFHQESLTINPNTDPVNQLQGQNPVMDAVEPVQYELHNLPPQAGYHQEAPPQQRMGPGMEPGFEANRGFHSPNQGQWGQQPDYPDQFQRVDQPQAQEVQRHGQQQDDGENWKHELHNLQPQAGHHQEALPQQRSGSGMEPDLDASPHFFSPNQGNSSQQPYYPDQFQQVDPRQEMQRYSGFDGSGPSTSSQQNFGLPDQHQYDGQN